MREYCKAYLLRDVRQFSGWSEQSQPGAQTLADDDLCYLWDDFIVVSSPEAPDALLFDAVTPEWRDFCTHTLRFAVPEAARPAAHQSDAQQADSIAP